MPSTPRLGWWASGGVVLFLLGWFFGPGGLTAFMATDHGAADHLGRLAADHPGWRGLWQVVSTIFSPMTWRILAAVVLLVVLVGLRQGRATRPAWLGRVPEVGLVGWAAAVLLGGLLPTTVKVLVDRPRPVLASVGAVGTSFPSGHAFGAAVFWFGAYLLVRQSRVGDPAAWRRSLWIVAGVGGIVVVLVCFARVALAVHYVTDVGAGLGLGIAYAAGCAALVGAVARRRSPQPAGPPGR